YLIAGGALHDSGHVYAYNGAAELAEIPTATYDRLLELGDRTRAETRRRFAEHETIPEGQRDVGIFWLSVDLLRDGLTTAAALERARDAGRKQCVPPLDEKLVRKQFKAAVSGSPSIRPRPSARATRRGESST